VTYLGGALMNGQMIRFAMVATIGIAPLAYALHYLHRLLEQSEQQVSAAKVAGERTE